MTIAGILNIKWIAYTTKSFLSLVEFHFSVHDKPPTLGDLINVALNNQMDLFSFSVYNSVHMGCRHWMWDIFQQFHSQHMLT